MAKTLTIKRLEKELKSKTNEELIAHICDLYETNKEVKMYLSGKFLGNEYLNEQLEKYKKKLEKNVFVIT